jgi:Flp pilus assembly protein TadB
MLDKIKSMFAGENKTMLYVITAIGAVLLVGKMMLPKPRRRKRKPVARRSTARKSTARRSTARRSTARKTRTRANGKKYTKGVNGKLLLIPAGKKPWQVKGSLAARNRMRKIRAMR